MSKGIDGTGERKYKDGLEVEASVWHVCKYKQVYA